MVGKSARFGILFLTITLAVIIIDQILKYLVLMANPQWSWGLFSFRLVKNTGAGFGLLKGYTPWLALVSLLVALAVVFLYPRIPQQKWPQLLASLFLGGVTGNLIDRLWRGQVIDFIDFKFWPAFNLADAAITLGALGLVIWFWDK